MLRFELLLAKKEKYHKNVHCFQEDVIDSYKKMSYAVTQIFRFITTHPSNLSLTNPKTFEIGIKNR